MKPLEITDHKRSWMPGYAVQIHSDRRGQAKAWCKNLVAKELLECYNYHMSVYTDVYQDTFYFHHPMIAQVFAEELKGELVDLKTGI